MKDSSCLILYFYIIIYVIIFSINVLLKVSGITSIYFLPDILEAGRKAIKSNNGLQLLYRFCTSCPEDKAYDCLLSRICGIINQCLDKKELPVPEMSPAR